MGSVTAGLGDAIIRVQIKIVERRRSRDLSRSPGAKRLGCREASNVGSGENRDAGYDDETVAAKQLLWPAGSRNDLCGVEACGLGRSHGKPVKPPKSSQQSLRYLHFVHFIERSASEFVGFLELLASGAISNNLGERDITGGSHDGVTQQRRDHDAHGDAEEGMQHPLHAPVAKRAPPGDEEPPRSQRTLVSRSNPVYRRKTLTETAVNRNRGCRLDLRYGTGQEKVHT